MPRKVEDQQTARNRKRDSQKKKQERNVSKEITNVYFPKANFKSCKKANFRLRLEQNQNKQNTQNQNTAW